MLAFSTVTGTGPAASEQAGADRTASTVPTQTRLPQRRIDVPRIGAPRQRRQPVGDFTGIKLAPVDESEALAKRGFECPIADGGATRHARARDIALDGGEFERQRRH